MRGAWCIKSVNPHLIQWCVEQFSNVIMLEGTFNQHHSSTFLMPGLAIICCFALRRRVHWPRMFKAAGVVVSWREGQVISCSDRPSSLTAVSAVRSPPPTCAPPPHTQALLLLVFEKKMQWIALKEPPHVRLKTDHQMWALDQSLEASKETIKVLKRSAAVFGKKQKHVSNIVTMISGGEKQIIRRQ